MNRKLRRALGLTGKAKRSAKLEKLEQENEALMARLDKLERHYNEVPGITEGRKDWFVLVGGEKVELRALTGEAWIKSLEELPSFLWSFAIEKEQGKDLEGKDYERIVTLAKDWIKACAIEPEEVNLDRLTMPEAEHAVTHIAELNGVTAILRCWFQERLEGVAATPSDGQKLRTKAELFAGRQAN